MDDDSLHKEIDIEKQQESNVKLLRDTDIWRFVHYCAFCIGGFTFLIGSLLYYPGIEFTSDGNSDGVAKIGVAVAWLYTIGSAGFLVVDLQEFFTFTEDLIVRINISGSVIGSLLYFIGSVGFFPKIYIWEPLIGIVGFVVGSIFIGFSQTWKLVRILSSPDEQGVTHNVAVNSRLNAACVEAGSMVGGYAFLIGTPYILFLELPVKPMNTLLHSGYLVQ
jgi:hypothetical protein